MAWVPTKLNEGHKALIDLIVANPTATAAELGARLGRTKEWVHLMKNSGMFKEQLALRQAEVVDPILVAGIEERLDMGLSRSLEVLNEKLAAPTASIDPELALKSAELFGKLQGRGTFGAKVAPPPAAPPTDRLERLTERLLAMTGRQEPQPIEDAVIIEQPKAA